MYSVKFRENSFMFSVLLLAGRQHEIDSSIIFGTSLREHRNPSWGIESIPTCI
jgi:hypothetical protein